jgi:uncharacterized delta-60 repeat protein
MAIQPDGKVVVLGRTMPEFGALARVNPDGSIDQGFGNAGFLIDTRLPPFASVALQRGDRPLVGVIGGFRLARYLPDGSPDVAFGDNGIAGTDEPEQIHFLQPGFGPTSLLVRPDNSIVVGGDTSALHAGDAEAWVKSYRPNGDGLETVGHLPLAAPADASYLGDLLEDAHGHLYGVGSTYPVSETRMQPFLARFLLGSGTNFDPSFAGGAGLARPELPASERFPSPSYSAVAGQGEQLLAAGRTDQTFLLSRFDHEGNVDSSFGNDGSAIPEIVGAERVPKGESWANDVTATGDGGIVVVGGTTQWAKKWSYSKSSGPICEECPQSVVGRFDADGNLDQGFGSGGLLHLNRPDGSTFQAEVKGVAALGGGKLLLEGTVGGNLASGPSFVARLNADGSYDTSFGSGGLTLLNFPCNSESESEKQVLGCVPTLQLKLRLGGHRCGRPAVFLQAKPSLPWSGIYRLNLTLPGGMRLKKGFRSKLRVTPVGSSEAEKMEVEVQKPEGRREGPTLNVERLGIASEVKVGLPRGSLRLNRCSRLHRKLRFGVRGYFTHAGWGGWDGYDQVVRRVRRAR